MEIHQINPTKNGIVNQFLSLPFKIYDGNPYWVPPMMMDEKRRFKQNRFPFYKHSDAAFFIAMNGKEASGRLAVINNRLFNEHNHEKTAFFYLFECVNELETASKLFQAGMEWARLQGLNKILGPKGFTALDGFGLLVEGFEFRPAMGIPYNPPYYSNLLEGIGFSSVSETVSGYLDASMKFPERIHELSMRIQARRGLTVARFKTRKDLKELIPKLKDLYNGALIGTEGGTPLTDEDANNLADQILWFADPKLIKIIEKKDPLNLQDTQLIGFLLAYPDISAALQKTKGLIFPFGWITILLELKKTDWININGAGLIKEYQGLGGTALLFSEMYKSIVESGQFRRADIVQIGLENQKMMREMVNFGIQFYKKHRIYQLYLE